MPRPVDCQQDVCEMWDVPCAGCVCGGLCDRLQPSRLSYKLQKVSFCCSALPFIWPVIWSAGVWPMMLVAFSSHDYHHHDGIIIPMVPPAPPVLAFQKGLRRWFVSAPYSTDPYSIAATGVLWCQALCMHGFCAGGALANCRCLQRT
jgi:hypothetical protein